MKIPFEDIKEGMKLKLISSKWGYNFTGTVLRKEGSFSVKGNFPGEYTLNSHFYNKEDLWDEIYEVH